jgi:hypothetical protein
MGEIQIKTWWTRERKVELQGSMTWSCFVWGGAWMELLSLSMARLSGGGGVRVSAPRPCRIPDVANVLRCLMLYLWS